MSEPQKSEGLKKSLNASKSLIKIFPDKDKIWAWIILCIIIVYFLAYEYGSLPSENIMTLSVLTIFCLVGVGFFVMSTRNSENKKSSDDD